VTGVDQANIIWKGNVVHSIQRWFKSGFTCQLFGWLYFSSSKHIAAFGRPAVPYIIFVHGILGVVMFGWGVSLLIFLPPVPYGHLTSPVAQGLPGQDRTKAQIFSLPKHAGNEKPVRRYRAPRAKPNGALGEYSPRAHIPVIPLIKSA
jgi:hypothetical protein